MRKLRCVVVGQVVTAALLSDRPLSYLVAGHQDRCLRCQAHGASIRSTRRALANMANTREVPPLELETAVLGTALVAGTEVEGKAWFPAAVAAAVLVAAAWAWRHREARA